MKQVLFLIISSFFFCSFSPKELDGLIQEVDTVGIVERKTISILFSGDIMGHSPQFNAAYNHTTKKYNYNTCFEQVKAYIESADFAFSNLEVPLAGHPYSGYPNFSSPDALLEALKYAGYDYIQTANNHVMDRSKAGLIRTIKIIQKNDLIHLGSYINRAQRDSLYPVIIEKDSLKIAVLNCTYGTNGIKVIAPNLVNMIDTVQIKQDIEKAKKLAADLIIMTIHWGIEYELKASNEQVNIAHFLVREGIDLIVGSHPHVVQNFDIIQYGSKNVNVYYSLGNSISNQRKIHTNGGIMIKVEIDLQSKSIVNTSYLPVYVHKGMLKGKYQFHLIPTTDFIKSPEKFIIAKQDSITLMNFDTNTRKRLHNTKLWE
jgi:poly-gamma-glutamate synthesis protein (capsule biosynthesis protein)